MVKQIVYIYIVHVALDVLEVQVTLLLALASHHGIVIVFAVLLLVLVLFFFVTLILVGFFQPLMGENLREGQSGLGLELDHPSDESLSFAGELVWEGELALQNQLMEVIEVGGLEGHSAAEHGEEQHSERPDVHKEALVPFVDDDFWSEISWSSALFLDHLALLDNF